MSIIFLNILHTSLQMCRGICITMKSTAICNSTEHELEHQFSAKGILFHSVLALWTVPDPKRAINEATLTY